MYIDIYKKAYSCAREDSSLHKGDLKACLRRMLFEKEKEERWEYIVSAKTLRTCVLMDPVTIVALCEYGEAESQLEMLC